VTLAQPILVLAMSVTVLTGCGLFAPSQSPEARVTLRVADAAMAAGDPQMALRVAEIVLRRHPDNVAAMVKRADALYALGAPDDARAAYRQAVAADPADAGAEIGLGRTLIRSDPHSAEIAFLAALARQPDNVLALNDLGIARDMQGHHAPAQIAYRQALAVAPDSADVRTNLGLSLALSGNETQAVGMLRPIATAPEATSLQRADLAMAVAGTGGIQGPPAAEEIPLAITPAPSVAVRRQDLPALAVLATAAPKGRAVPMPPVDLALLTADASAIESPDRPMRSVIIPPDFAPPLATGPKPSPTQAAVHLAKPRAMAVGAPVRRPNHDRTPVAGYYVQMAALDSAEAASAQWRKMRARWPALLGDRTPAVQQAEINDRTFWRLRTGLFASAGVANAFCTKLRALGSGCWTIATRD
jgi:Flp pilus assembly protein TadD